jgi:hypothetical protein
MVKLLVEFSPLARLRLPIVVLPPVTFVVVVEFIPKPGWVAATALVVNRPRASQVLVCKAQNSRALRLIPRKSSINSGIHARNPVMRIRSSRIALQITA